MSFCGLEVHTFDPPSGSHIGAPSILSQRPCASCSDLVASCASERAPSGARDVARGAHWWSATCPGRDRAAF
jgi:hypothetical protein